MATVMLPSSLRRYAQQQSRLSCNAASVAEALERLSENSSELRNHLFSGPSLRSFVVICKNGQDIRLLDGLSTSLDHDDEVLIVASVAGG